MVIIKISKARLNAIYGYWNEESFDKRLEEEKVCMLSEGFDIAPQKETSLPDKTKEMFAEQKLNEGEKK